MDNYKFWDLYH